MVLGEVTGQRRWFHNSKGEKYGYDPIGGRFGGMGCMDLNIMQSYARGDMITYRVLQ